MTHNSDTVQDVRLYTEGTNLLMLEYGTTLSTLRTLCRQQGLKVTKVEVAGDGKTDVYVTPRYKGSDPYTGEETYAGYRPRVGTKST